MKGKENTTESTSEATEITKCEQTYHTGQSSANVCTHEVSFFIVHTTDF